MAPKYSSSQVEFSAVRVVRTVAVAAILIVVALYVLHQDIWFWREARPLVFGVLPIGLFYHAAYTALIAMVLAWLVRTRWPEHLEASNEEHK